METKTKNETQERRYPEAEWDKFIGEEGVVTYARKDFTKRSIDPYPYTELGIARDLSREVLAVYSPEGVPLMTFSYVRGF